MSRETLTLTPDDDGGDDDDAGTYIGDADDAADDSDAAASEGASMCLTTLIIIKEADNELMLTLTRMSAHAAGADDGADPGAERNDADDKFVLFSHGFIWFSFHVMFLRS
jgi:hypothetical protein